MSGKILIVTAALVFSSAVATSAVERTYLFSFGDSYSKTLWNPDGSHPCDDNPIGNPPLPGHTSTGGLSWPGFMVTHFNASSAWLYNFARGGAVVNRQLINNFEYIPETLDLIEQVALFDVTIRQRPTWVPWTAENSIASVWMGFNDVRQTWSSLHLPNLYSKMVQDYMNQVQQLYRYGIQNFIFMTVAPIYLTPEQQRLSTPRYNQLVRAAELFNRILKEQIPINAAKMPNINYKIVDTWIPFAKAYQNPTEFGAPNPTCCNADGISCLWYNLFHPGVRISELIAAEVAMTWNTADFNCPENLKACSNNLTPTPFPSRASMPESTSIDVVVSNSETPSFESISLDLGHLTQDSASPSPIRIMPQSDQLEEKPLAW